jgi:hypothetical protein
LTDKRLLLALAPLAWLAGGMLELSRHIAEFFSRLEPDWRIPDPPLWLALSFTGALILLALVARRRSYARWVAFAAVCVLFGILVVHPFAPVLEAGQLEVTVVDVGQGDSVLVVGPENKPQTRQVQLGDAQGNDWIVLSGLQAGERVIVEGFQKMMVPGAPVDPTPWSGAAPRAQGAASGVAPAASAVGAGKTS